MDLLGGYNSDSDSDESSDAKLPVSATIASVKSSMAIRTAQDTKLHPPTVSKPKRKADKKKRVIGKKLLKLSSVLPEHILNQLQQGGGGDSKQKHIINDDSDDDSTDDNSINGDKKKPLARRKTTTPTAKDYSRDEGLMGLLSELSKSKSSISAKKQSSSKILGSDKPFTPPVQEEEDDDDPSEMQQSPAASAEKPKASTRSQSAPLGAAFLTTTVETIRKRKGSTSVRNIHEDSTTASVDDAQGTASVHSSSQESSVPRPPISNAAPKPQITPSLRSAAPPVRIPSNSYYSQNAYAPAAVSNYLRHPKEHSSAGNPVGARSLQQQQQQQQQQQRQAKKKKPLSRKKQMEQMLRAGKLDQVEGDHQVEGVAHEYNLDGDAAVAAASVMTSSGAGVRVVPTSSYDPSLGGTSASTKVTSRQKYSNQLNSLLASAASLETQRAQNPHLMGQKGKRGAHNAAMKRKYGW